MCSPQAVHLIWTLVVLMRWCVSDTSLCLRREGFNCFFFLSVLCFAVTLLIHLFIRLLLLKIRSRWLIITQTCAKYHFLHKADLKHNSYIVRIGFFFFFQVIHFCVFFLFVSRDCSTVPSIKHLKICYTGILKATMIKKNNNLLRDSS